MVLRLYNLCIFIIFFCKKYRFNSLYILLLFYFVKTTEHLELRYIKTNKSFQEVLVTEVYQSKQQEMSKNVNTKLTLLYFPPAGRAGISRLILAYAGVNYNNKIVEFGKLWPHKASLTCIYLFIHLSPLSVYSKIP